MAPLVVPRTRAGTKSSDPLEPKSTTGLESGLADDATLRTSAMKAWRARKDAMLRSHDYSAYPDLFWQYFYIQFFCIVSRSFVRLGVTCPREIVESLRRYAAAR